MEIIEIISFLKENIEPLPDLGAGKSYRCSVNLKDGLYLPCVLFQNLDKRVELAKRRFKETQPRFFGLVRPNAGGTYDDIVRVFAASGNRINEYDISKLELSPFAIPLVRLKEIKGETSMGWTGFDAVMKDGKSFCFGTSFFTEFFNIPDGYTANDIERIVPHQMGTRPSHPVYRERPFFECYINGI